MQRQKSLFLSISKVVVCAMVLALLAMICFGAFVPKQTKKRILYQLKTPEKGQVEKVSADPSLAYDPTATLEKLLEAIKPLVSDPHLGEVSSDILAKADDYRKFFRENLRPVRGIRIDVITQDHFNDFDADHVSPQIVESQERISTHLDAMGYDLVLGEGFKAREINDDTLLLDFYELLSRKRAVQDRREMERRGVDLSSYESFAKSPFIKAMQAQPSIRNEYDAVYQYSRTHPENTYGAEDALFIELHHTVLEDTWGPRVLDGRIEYLVNTVAPLASKIRAEFAVAKAVEVLRARKQRSAIIVYGFGHLDQFRAMAKSLGYECTIYNSVPGRTLAD
ncbi:MAG TPA: hypothetical protein VFT82_01620 [Candidatus Paceibacterota bacterium]|nr:hypothetical protein [Candidatus Paceibacterota bacterium]